MSNGLTPPTLTEIVTESVQSGTFNQSPTQYGGFDSWLMGYQDNRLPLAAWWTPARDRDLRAYLRKSMILSALVYNRVTEVQNLEWVIEADDKKLEHLIPYYIALFEDSEFGEGFRTFIGKWVQDRLTQDNGAFIELIGYPSFENQPLQQDQFGNKFIATKPLGDVKASDPPHIAKIKTLAAIQSFAHVDAQTVWRTPNKEYPYVYQNPWRGYLVFLHRSRMIGKSQLPSSSELSRGIGFCGTSRAFQAMEIIQAGSDYNYEKLTGASPALGIVKGLAIRAIQQALEDHKVEMDQAGFVRWQGAALLQGDAIPGVEPGIQFVDVKNLPEGHDGEQNFTINLYLISLALGTNLRALGWSKMGAGDTKADAEVQSAQTANKGEMDDIDALQEIITTRFLPKGLSFHFRIKDQLQEHRKAEIEKIRAEARSIRIASGELTPEEAREIAAREGDLPPEFMATQTIVEGDSNPTTDPVSPVDNNLEAVVSGKSIGTYQRALLSLINQYRKGLIDEASFKLNMRQLITKQFALGWQAGAREVGEFAFSPTAQFELDKLISEEVVYVQGFADAVMLTKALPTLADIRRRASIWANQFLRLKNRAMLFLGGDKRLEWKEGDTVKKCRSCLSLDGYVMTAKQWSQRNIFPQDHTLECKGFNCDCHLEVTTKPLSTTPFPIDKLTLSPYEEVL